MAAKPEIDRKEVTQSSDWPEDRERPDCWRCRHYFIRHDPRFPYGCRAMQFESRRLPAIEVREVSGMPCQWFAPRPPKTER